MKYDDRRYTSVYEKLVVRCDTPLDSHLFDMAIEQGHVDACLDGDITLDDLANEIDGYAATMRLSKKTRRKSGSSHAGSEPAEKPGNHRAHALNAIFAIEAAARVEVTGFRTDHLAAGLVDISEVAAWIEQTAEHDGPATAWITVPEEALDDATLAQQAALGRLPGYSEDTHFVRYVTDGARYTHAIPTHHDGVLAHLADTAHWIAVRYGWTEAAAATFILTGLPPAAVGIRAKTIGPWPASKANRRIELDISLTATSEEVAEAFLRLRDEMLGDQPKSRRSFTKRTADLAVFAREHSTGYTWEEAKTIWNRQQTEAEGKRYYDKAQFASDARIAYKRTTGEKLDWKRKGTRSTRTPRDDTQEK
jgi:hypothetical protein